MRKQHSDKRIYFPGLTGLRFLAAITVVFCHVEEFKYIWGIREEGTWDLHFFSLMGELAVTFFFVLSGFLITYLLLVEKEKTGTIAMKQFYMRRVLRIFPLYYLIVILGLFVFPHFEILDFPDWTEQIAGNFWLKALMYAFFLSNLAAASIFPIPYAVHTWSIGVEEQFYMLWPFLVKYFKKTFSLLVGIIVVYLIFAKGFWYLDDLNTTFDSMGRENHVRAYEVLAGFFRFTRIDCMAIGGLAAYAIYLNKTKFLDVVFSKYFQLGLYGLVLAIFFTHTEFGYFTQEVYAVLFALIILNIGNNKNTFFQLEHPAFKYLGKISYGLYMYNYLCVRLAIVVTQYFFGKDTLLGWQGNILLYFLAIVFTTALAAFSYEFFEKRFLRLKHRFTVVKSGEAFQPKVEEMEFPFVEKR